VSALEDGETLMVLEAPPNVSIASVPGTLARPKPAGRQYTKEDLKVSSSNTEVLYLDSQKMKAVKPDFSLLKINTIAVLVFAAERKEVS
jgi:hypothetical protein